MRFTNTGGLPHEFAFARIEEGKTEADVKAVIESGGEPPEWAEDIAGVPGLSPGQSITVTRTLEPGSYVFLCFFPDPEGTPHAALGHVRAVHDRRGHRGCVPRAGRHASRRPTTDSSSPPCSAGEQTVQFENGGTEPHELALVALEPGKGLKDVDGWIEGGYQGEPPVTFLGGMQTIPAGESVFLTIDLEPGRGLHGRGLHDELEGDVHGLLAGRCEPPRRRPGSRGHGLPAVSCASACSYELHLRRQAATLHIDGPGRQNRDRWLSDQRTDDEAHCSGRRSLHGRAHAREHRPDRRSDTRCSPTPMRDLFFDMHQRDRVRALRCASGS